MNQPFGRGAAIRAALQMTGSTYVIYATGLLVSALIARSVGPADFGRYSYLVWLAGVLIMVGNNGLTTSAIRFVSEHQPDAGRPQCLMKRCGRFIQDGRDQFQVPFVA